MQAYSFKESLFALHCIEGSYSTPRTFAHSKEVTWNFGSIALHPFVKYYQRDPINRVWLWKSRPRPKPKFSLWSPEAAGLAEALAAGLKPLPAARLKRAGAL